ncbi:11448_t:CDS:2, partial [Diversispora eburnea]
ANGMSDKAFDLSEAYEDYKSLVSLIMESNLDVDKYIEIYMLKYKEKFAYMLYEWYFEKERYADLLSQQHAIKHKEWLQKFLNERNLNGISWIHDINMRQYSDASIKTRHLAQKTFLSISKLTYLAELKDDSELKSDQVQETLDEIEKCGELVTAYKEIQDQFIKAATSSNQKFYDEYDQVNYIAKKVIKETQESRPSLAKLFIQCIPRILRGGKVSTEELVEVITLRDVKQKDDYPFVLLLVSDDKLLPDSRRRELLQTIWRRIYITDRWDWISDTNDMSDEEINERITNTAVFRTLFIVTRRYEKPLSQWFNPPASSFFASTVEQLQSRFPTFKEEQIKELIEDYKKENTALQHSIQELQLNTHVEHALRLLNLKSSLGDEDQLDPMEVEEDT